MDCRTIRVCGLPKDIPQKRLSDKLKIHFLRKKNGGGEISSVTVLETTPASALITFDECDVAQIVVHHGIQTLSLNDKEYRVTVSLQEEETDPNELFIDLAVTVDHNKLPGGKTALSGILMNFQDIKMYFHPKGDFCTLSGRYSRVQTLTKSLLDLTSSKKLNTSDFQFPQSEVISDQNKYHSTKGQLENKRETEQACGIDLSKYSSRRFDRNQTPQRASNINHSEVSKDPEVGASLEDFSMILDTDIFRYIQHCSKEYKSILERHGVEVLDVTTKDITTLYLQSQAGIVGKSVECIQRAHVELGCLYQKKEAQLRKVSLPKEGLPTQGLQQAIEVVIQTFPKLLINEDKANVYLVGSGTDVSEAKQFLMDMEGTTDEHGGDKIKPPDAFFQVPGSASPPFMPETHVNKHLRQGRDEKTKMHKMDHNFGRVLSVDKSKDNTFCFNRVEVTAEEDQTYALLATKSNQNDQLSESGSVSEFMSLKFQPSFSSYRAGDVNVLAQTGEYTPFKSFEVKVHSATLNYDQNPAATNFTIDGKMGQAISVTNSSSSRNSEHVPSDYSHQVDSKQGNKEPKIKFRADVDYFKEDDVSKSPVKQATTDPFDQKHILTNTHRESCLEGNGRDFTPLSDSSIQRQTGSKSSQTLNSETQLSQTLDAALQTTITQKVSCEEKQKENSTKANATGTAEAGTGQDNAVNVNSCLWCHGKVNPHCGMCRESDAMNLPSSNDRHSGSNQYGDKPVEHPVEKHGQVCGCGIKGESVTSMACGLNLCPVCKEKLHSKCRVCPKSEEIVSGIRGTMTWKEMSLSLPGHIRDTSLKITYNIPDGIQGTDHPHPGAPFKGGTFSAFLPMNETTRKLLPSLEEAFNQGNIFHVKEKGNMDTVTWGNSIPHKTNMDGGKSKNGFPDSSYLRCLSNALKSQGIKAGKNME